MSVTTPRRIRVCVCPYCAFLFQAQRASAGDEHALQQCMNCCFTFPLGQARTWLEEPKQTATGSAA